MTDPVDFFWKMAGLLGMVCAAVLWGLKQQGIKTKSDSENKAKFDAMVKKSEEQDKHMEYQDEKSEEISDKLGKISDQISQFGLFDLRLKNLEHENTERKEENRLMMRKLDSIFNKMNQIEVSMSGKANKP